MAPYITFREKDAAGELQYYVLQRDFPHYIGLLCYHPKDNPLAQAAIPGYNLYVVITEVLRGRFIPAEKDVAQQMQIIAENMGAWFWSERIAMDEKKYKKFKIQPNVTSA